jgi:Tfp pilus assembly PilM family ATPase
VVPRAVIDDYIALFEKCGMTPVSFLIENQAITRSIISLEDMETYLVVNIGKTKTVLSIVNEQAVQFTSTVNIGGDDFATAIAKENSISKEEAERMIREKGFVRTESNNDFFLSLINVASALRDEIQRVYMYWLSHVDKNGKDPMGPFKILLTGRDSSIIGFREYMALSLKVPVDLANVWINVLSFDQEIPPIDHLDSLNYAIVIGLALPKSRY